MACEQWALFGSGLSAASGLPGLFLSRDSLIGQHDIKRLLAYHSIENIGIIVMGLGLAWIGRAMGRADWVALGLAGAILHVWNHALFKSLLFFSAGSVIHATHTREIDQLGGLAKTMPWTSLGFLIGAVAICGLPPLNGFVSELMIYLGLFRTLGIGGGAACPWAAFVAPALALIGGLASACFVKVYGATFLGAARQERTRHAHESSPTMLLALVVTSLCCAVIGVAPWLVVPAIQQTVALAGTTESLTDLLPLHSISVAAAVHLALTWQLLHNGPATAWNGWLALDPLNRFFLGFVSVFFLICALYAPGYLRLRPERSNRILCTCMPLSLAMMSLVILSHHLGLLWIAIEASTMTTAPSLYFNHNPRSLEASWKYLLICSVGIALALLGSFFLACSALHAGLESTLLFDGLVEQAPRLSRPWLHAAYVLLIVGYGTKMGLAPMHTWKPDAYGEAPGMIGAMMAGGMTSCAFLAILRIYHIANAAHDAEYLQRIMLLLGLLSMGTAAVFMVRQRDIKRLLAYSSVEHMGMLMFGIGIGGAGVLSSLLHVVHNGFTKGVLFLAAANIHRTYGSKFTDDLQGVLRRLPFSGAMFIAGFFAITGAPPFAPFVSEFQMLAAAFQQQHYVSGGLFMFFLMFVFIGFGWTVMSISFGAAPPDSNSNRGFHESFGTSLPILISIVLVFILGVYNPPSFDAAVKEAAQFLTNTH